MRIVDRSLEEITNGSVLQVEKPINGERLFVVLDVLAFDVRYAHDLSRVFEGAGAELLCTHILDVSKRKIVVLGNIYCDLDKFR